MNNSFSTPYIKNCHDVLEPFFYGHVKFQKSIAEELFSQCK